MNAGWQVLDFMGFSGSLRYSRGQLILERQDSDEKIAVPLSRVAVILIGISTSVSGALLAKFSEYDISVLVCDWRGVPVAGAYPWAEHSRIGARQIAQSSMPRPRTKSAWSAIVRAKVAGQAHTLGALGLPGRHELQVLAKHVRSGDPDNVEAQAARKYWSLISVPERFARIPGAQPDIYNSALDYGYTILRGHAIRAASSAGLCTTLGVFHRGRSNPFNLVDDLIEPFRPAMDFCVFNARFTEAELGKDAKSRLVEFANSQFTRSGETIPTVLQKFAQNFGRYAEGDLDSLDVPVWKGPFDAEEG